MKQHITVEQLLELEDFVEICKVLGVTVIGFMNMEETPSNLITIGKMIEILGKEIIEINLVGNPSVRVRGRKKTDRYGLPNRCSLNYDSQELCDALWEATKYVLKDNEL